MIFKINLNYKYEAEVSKEEAEIIKRKLNEHNFKPIVDSIFFSCDGRTENGEIVDFDYKFEED